MRFVLYYGRSLQLQSHVCRSSFLVVRILWAFVRSDFSNPVQSSTYIFSFSSSVTHLGGGVWCVWRSWCESILSSLSSILHVCLELHKSVNEPPKGDEGAEPIRSASPTRPSWFDSGDGVSSTCFSASPETATQNRKFPHYVPCGAPPGMSFNVE